MDQTAAYKARLKAAEAEAEKMVATAADDLATMVAESMSCANHFKSHALSVAIFAETLLASGVGREFLATRLAVACSLLGFTADDDKESNDSET